METLLWCKHAYHSHTHTREAAEKEEETTKKTIEYTQESIQLLLCLHVMRYFDISQGISLLSLQGSRHNATNEY